MMQLWGDLMGDSKTGRPKNSVISVRKSVHKYQTKMAQINFRVKPEVKADFLDHAATSGESLQGFIVRACYAQIERDEKE